VGERVRLAGWRDLLAVHRIHRACFPHPYSLWRFVGYLLSTSAWLYVACADGVPVGYIVAALTHYQHPPRNVGEVISVAVLPSHRGGGLARGLLGAGIASLQAAGVTEIYLQVAVSNHRAKHLYERFGFTVKQRLSQYYTDGEDALLMALPEGWDGV